MRTLPACVFVLAFALLCNGASAAEDEEKTASFAVDATVKVLSDQTRRSMSDSLNDPGAKLSVEVAHKSGLIGLWTELLRWIGFDLQTGLLPWFE